MRKNKLYYFVSNISCTVYMAALAICDLFPYVLGS